MKKTLSFKQPLLTKSPFANKKDRTAKKKKLSKESLENNKTHPEKNLFTLFIPNARPPVHLGINPLEDPRGFYGSSRAPPEDIFEDRLES